MHIILQNSEKGVLRKCVDFSMNFRLMKLYFHDFSSDGYMINFIVQDDKIQCHGDLLQFVNVFIELTRGMKGMYNT